MIELKTNCEDCFHSSVCELFGDTGVANTLKEYLYYHPLAKFFDITMTCPHFFAKGE